MQSTFEKLNLGFEWGFLEFWYVVGGALEVSAGAPYPSLARRQGALFKDVCGVFATGCRSLFRSCFPRRIVRFFALLRCRSNAPPAECALPNNAAANYTNAASYLTLH
jgi:hypothetical protein